MNVRGGPQESRLNTIKAPRWIMLFGLLEVVPRYRDPQLKVPVNHVRELAKFQCKHFLKMLIEDTSLLLQMLLFLPAPANTQQLILLRF